MTAFSDETGGTRKRDAYIGVLASLAAAISLLENTPRSKKAAASDKMFDQMVADYKKALDEGRAALSAAPVAQEPVAYQYRACIAGKWGDWTDLHQSVEGFRNGPWKSRLENGTCELRALYAGTPPATPAGLGADEIAQIIATKCFDPRVIDSSGKPFWKKSQWREAQQAANAILALLSRAGDQSNSTHEEQSTQSI